jgi:hypothetical protein
MSPRQAASAGSGGPARQPRVNRNPGRNHGRLPLGICRFLNRSRAIVSPPVQRKFAPRTSVAYLGLLASLLLGYFSARNHELTAFSSPLLSLSVACVLLTIPLFFSGFVFSTLIEKPNQNVSTALAYNLMGTLFGGLMEYNSMYFGFAFLYLLAIGFYALAWVFSLDPAAALARRPGLARQDAG